MAPRPPYISVRYDEPQLAYCYLWQGQCVDATGAVQEMNLKLHEEACQLTDAALQAVGFSPRPSWAQPGGWSP